MGECGCASSRLFQARLGWRDPKWTYTVALHPGCRECETGPAFMLERYSKEDARDFDIHHLPLAQFDNGGCHFRPGVEPDKLFDALRDSSGVVMEDFDDVATTGDIAGCLSDAVHATAKEHQRSVLDGQKKAKTSKRA